MSIRPKRPRSRRQSYQERTRRLLALWAHQDRLLQATERVEKQLNELVDTFTLAQIEQIARMFKRGAAA